MTSYVFFWNSEFQNRNSDFSIFQQRNSIKIFPTGIFGIGKGSDVPLPMGVPEIGTKNRRNSQPRRGRLQFSYETHTAGMKTCSETERIAWTLYLLLLHSGGRNSFVSAETHPHHVPLLRNVLLKHIPRPKLGLLKKKKHNYTLNPILLSGQPCVP